MTTQCFSQSYNSQSLSENEMIHCTLMTQNENISQHDITLQEILAQQQTASVSMEELRGMLYMVKQQLAALLPLLHFELISSPLILVRIHLLTSTSRYDLTVYLLEAFEGKPELCAGFLFQCEIAFSHALLRTPQRLIS